MTPWPSAVDVTTADVFKGDIHAARLHRTPDGVEFRYLADYTGPAVATTLPVGRAPAARPGGALPSFFTGLLPEGRRLSALRRAVKTSVDDELSLLLAVGGDTIGDVRVVEAGTVPSPIPPRAVLDGRLDFRRLLAQLDVIPDRSGLPGVQAKASAAMITLPATSAGVACILKLDPPEYPGLTQNEALMLMACRRTGLEAATATLLQDDHGEHALAVVRFDRRLRSGASTALLAVEDGCQVLGRAPGDKYVVGYEAAFAALAAVCDARLLAVRTLLAQLAFAIVTGNGDAHAKNFSVLQQPDGEWRVTPAYDVPSSQPYGDSTLAMAVNGRRSDVGARDLLALAAALGLPEPAGRRVLRNTVEAVDTWLPLLDDMPYDLARRRKLARVVDQRRSRLSPA